jgi:hypothetical protein
MKVLGLPFPLLICWTAPATSIAMYQIAVAVVRRRESPFGREQRFMQPQKMAAAVRSILESRH